MGEPTRAGGNEVAQSLRGFGDPNKKSGDETTASASDKEILDRHNAGLQFIRAYYIQLEGKIKEGEPLHSMLSAERQLEILKKLLEDLESAKEWQKKIERKSEIERRYKSIDPSKAQWATVATTPPVVWEYSDVAAANTRADELRKAGSDVDVIEKEDGGASVEITGNRISFAFWKNMCVYKEKVEGGCRFCMLSEQNSLAGDVTVEQQLASLENALKRTQQMGSKNNVLEILPDGSFLNEREVPIDTQIGMMQRISKEKNIHKVAIETRPEYCNANKVRKLLDELDPNQKLEIYFGLETTDAFVGSIIHKKGYGFDYFKERIERLLEGLTEDEKNRLELSVYNIIKPVYVTEQESVELSVKMAEDISEFSQKIGFPIHIKYEPSVVSAGSTQDYLYNKKDETTGEREFKPLSYLSVAELIARLAEKKLDHQAKFGQRDDIDNFSTVSMVSRPDDESMFSQFDFMVYNAIQRFNTSHNLRGFFVDMKIVMDHSEEFELWEKGFYGNTGASALSRLSKDILSDDSPFTEEENERTNFQKVVWQACDEVEYNKSFSDILRKNAKNKAEEVKTSIRLIFQNKNVTILDKESDNGVDIGIKDFIFIDTGDDDTPRISAEGTNPAFLDVSEMAAYQVEIIILNEAGQPQSLWVKIPLQHQEIPSKPDFIYTE